VPGKDFASDAPSPPVNWQGLLGYLNYGEGRPDPRFQGQLGAAYFLAAEKATDGKLISRLADLLDEQLTALQQQGASAFREIGQARTAIQAAFRDLPPAYRRHHADLLANQPDEVLFTPFFLARACEAVLAARSASSEASSDRLAAEAVSRLNDFVGYRPIPVLENRRAGEVYDHERFRPVPLYLRGVGIADGKHQKLVRTALNIIAETELELLEEAQFDPALLDELALDPRPYDHNHPANRRPNHVFGEWDPHLLDNQGRFRRFVVRKDTLDALLGWADGNTASAPIADNDRGERLFDAAAVMAGTMLMASALCGRGPTAHDSGASLSTLVPRIARLRDRFYVQLLATTVGPRGERLRREAETARQPLGNTRQSLNQMLAQQRAFQLQERHLALLFAALGYPGESRQRASAIATASVRMAAEVRSRITTAGLLSDRGNSVSAAAELAEAEDVLHCGIACGALADPWTMLGFQGLYPLFQSREDAIHDSRIDELLELAGDLFGVHAQAIGEAAARGQEQVREQIASRMQSLANWWDQFAGYEVADLPRVHGGEATAAAEHVANALTRWRQRGTQSAAPSDVAFWREHLEGFRTPAAFARVVAALLDRGDRPAAMGLLVAWLGETPDVPLEDGEHSFHALVRRWAEEVCAGSGSPDRPRTFRRFFEALEANAEDYWQVPSLAGDGPEAISAEDVYGAAYEGVTFRDSADDGTEGAVLGDAPPDSDFSLEHETDRLSDRLQFLATVADLWRTAARCLPGKSATVSAWLAIARENRDRLGDLLDQLHGLIVPEPPTGFEGAVEYDRRRSMKEHVTELALIAAVVADRAIRALCAATEEHHSSPTAPLGKGAAGLGSQADGWEPLAVDVERRLTQDNPSATAAALKQLLPTLRKEPLLYVPLAAGGHPRPILRARSAQAMLHDLMEQLPRLGLLREAFAIVQTARAMEQASPPEGRKVTEFDRLFPVALQATVNAVLDLADGSNELSDEQLPKALKRVTDPYLVLWVEHSQTLRLSVLESVQSPVEWERLRGFVQRYGQELFTAGFLNLANLRSVLHRGVSTWLDELSRQEDAPEKFLDELDDKLPRAQCVRLLEIVLQAVVENYDEYRDYNTTTTQSDYGENLFVLLDFLRLKAAYERDNWRMRPLVLVHEILCRRDRITDVAAWQEEIVQYTREHADRHLGELADIEARHGLKLRTVRDRLNERFVAPLMIDRMCALVGPARVSAAADERETSAAFFRLKDEITAFTATPTGVGLEVPLWLRRLEGELNRVRQEPTQGAPPRSRLTVEQLRNQLGREWGGPLED
jgi:hypothetical protein